VFFQVNSFPGSIDRETSCSVHSRAGFVPAPFGRGHISRTIRVTANRPSAFSAGIAANGLVSISGGIVDSYSSCLGAYSTNNSLGTNGSIATRYQSSSAIKVTGGKVYGRASTGPGGTVTTSGSGSIGDADWNATHTGIEAGWTDDTVNVAFPTNAPPTGYESFPLIPPATIVGVSNITYLGTGNYQAASFTSSSKTKPMIVNGDAVVYLSGNLTVSGDGYIQINPGSSLTLYVGGSNPTISGGGVVNGTLQPKNFTYYGLNTSTKLTVSGGGTFIGTVNAPQAAPFTISGSGGMFGAAIVGTYVNSGGASFHYDECLGTPSGFYTVTSWREL